MAEVFSDSEWLPPFVLLSTIYQLNFPSYFHSFINMAFICVAIRMILRLFHVVHFHPNFSEGMRRREEICCVKIVVAREAESKRNGKKCAWAFLVSWCMISNGMRYDPPKSNHQLAIPSTHVNYRSIRNVQSTTTITTNHTTSTPCSSHSLPFSLSTYLPPSPPFLYFIYFDSLWRIFHTCVRSAPTEDGLIELKGDETNERASKRASEWKIEWASEMVNSNKIEDQNIQPTILMYPHISTTSNLQSFCMKFWTDLILLNASLCSRKPILMLFFEVDNHFL